MKAHIAKSLLLLSLAAVFLFLSCVSSTDTMKPNGQAVPSFGPVLTFGGTLTNYSLAYYTPALSMDSLELHFSNTNITLQETASNNYHRFTFQRSGNSTNFTYTIVTTDAALSNRSGKVAIPENTNRYHFIAYGDNRTQYDIHRSICKAMAVHHPAFVLHNGDLVTDGSDMAEWPLFFDSALPIATNTIFIPAAGNHEFHSPILTNLFTQPVNGFFYYSLHFPGLNVFVVDTCSDYSTNSTQYAWLTNELESSGSGWKIALFHHAPYSSTYHYNDADKPELQSVLVPVMARYRVNLVLNGHDHIYERSTNSNVVFLTTGGGGGPLHTSIYTNVHLVKRITNTHHFIVIDMVSNIMDLQVMDSNNAILDSFSLTNTN